MPQQNENNSRRKFFKTIGLGTLGAGFISFYPFKLFAGTSFSGNKIQIKIHPSAVKRNK